MADAVRLRRKRLQQDPVPSHPPARRTITIWCPEWLTRPSPYGDFHHLLQELNREDTSGYNNLLRIEPKLLRDGGPAYSNPRQKSIRMRAPLSVWFKLAVIFDFRHPVLHIQVCNIAWVLLSLGTTCRSLIAHRFLHEADHEREKSTPLSTGNLLQASVHEFN